MGLLAALVPQVLAMLQVSLQTARKVNFISSRRNRWRLLRRDKVSSQILWAHMQDHHKDRRSRIQMPALAIINMGIQIILSKVGQLLSLTTQAYIKIVLDTIMEVNIIVTIPRSKYSLSQT